MALAALPCTWLRPAVTRCTPGWSQAADKRCMWACRLWAASDLQHIKTIEVGKAWVTDCLYLPSARRLVCSSADRAVRRQDAPAAWNVDCARHCAAARALDCIVAVMCHPRAAIKAARPAAALLFDLAPPCGIYKPQPLEIGKGSMPLIFSWALLSCTALSGTTSMCSLPSPLSHSGQCPAQLSIWPQLAAAL